MHVENNSTSPNLPNLESDIIFLFSFIRRPLLRQGGTWDHLGRGPWLFCSLRQAAFLALERNAKLRLKRRHKHGCQRPALVPGGPKKPAASLQQACYSAQTQRQAAIETATRIFMAARKHVRARRRVLVAFSIMFRIKQPHQERFRFLLRSKDKLFKSIRCMGSAHDGLLNQVKEAGKTPAVLH